MMDVYNSISQQVAQCPMFIQLTSSESADLATYLYYETKLGAISSH
jgi:hypothetical protein